jgi:hypothetical protein
MGGGKSDVKIRIFGLVQTFDGNVCGQKRIEALLKLRR